MSFSFPFRGPIPPYTNVPIESQNYSPSQFFISNIVLGISTIVTTTQNVNYLIGQLVRLIIPPQFGCRQLNEQSGYVLSLPAANQVQIAINSSVNVDAFVNSSSTTKPQILPVGDINNGQMNTMGITNTGTSIPGSFINISP